MVNWYVLAGKEKKADIEGKAVVPLPLTSHLQACFGNNLQMAHEKFNKWIAMIYLLLKQLAK